MPHPTPHPVFKAERAARRAVARVQQRNLAFYAANPREIETRLVELDAELDIERAMDIYALRAAAVGGVLSVLRSRSWVLVPLAAALMLGMQATTGDSALRGLLRRLGYRTAQEIAAEEDALMDILAKAGPEPPDAPTSPAPPSSGRRTQPITPATLPRLPPI